MPKTETVQELARQHTVKATNALATIMGDTEADAADRVSAARAILDLGWGEPEQHIECRGIT